METNMIEETVSQVQPFEAQAKIFKVLTHPARIAILEILRDGEHCVCHMESRLGLRQAYISQQLAVLREAELIQDRRDGWNIYYRVVDMSIFEILNVARKITGAEIPDINQIGFQCTCPRCIAEQQALVRD
jgi:ArsR family transcriptional regulator